MTDFTMEWNVAFSPDEVIPRLENLFRQYDYTYNREDRGADRHYRTTLGQGTLELVMHPLEPKHSPFSPTTLIQRTLLRMTYKNVGRADQTRFKHQLTMAFLRVGG